MTAPAPRLPIEPLLALCGGGVHIAANAIAGDRWRNRAHEAVARRLHEARRLGGLTWWTADRYAVALGHHPSAIWPIEWWALDISDGSTPDGADVENGATDFPVAPSTNPQLAAEPGRAA